jgi:hypothetical protein
VNFFPTSAFKRRRGLILGLLTFSRTFAFAQDSTADYMIRTIACMIVATLGFVPVAADAVERTYFIAAVG